MTKKRRLRGLLRAMSLPRTFYVLGAGASYGLVPVTQQMRSFVEDENYNIGIYPASPAPHGPLFERVIGSIAPDETDIRKLLLRNMPDGTLDFLAQRALWMPSHQVVPTQYAVFEVLGSPSTLFTFNLDGLADLHCRHRHLVLEPHGHIDYPWFEHGNYSELLEATSAYGVTIPHLSPKLLFAPESAGITENRAYVYARKLFAMAPAVIIVGYSFSRQGSTYDDAESLEYIISLLKTRSLPTFVVSTDPEELVETLRDRLASFNVFGFSLRWELFSGTILAYSDPLAGIQSKWCNGQLDVFASAYDRSVDAQ